MLINYLKITLRNFRKNYVYTTLNILGLAIGFAALIIIAVYLHYETSYEHFHTKAERIYRPTYRFQSEGEYAVHWARIPVDYINELPNDMPEVEALVRFQNYERKYIRVGDEKFIPKHAYVTDPEVFQVFDFPLVAGNPETALAQPHAVVLTQSAARRYFGEENAIDKELYVTSDFSAEEMRYTVTGIMADLPSNTHLPVDMLFSFQNPEERSGWAYVYALLQHGAHISEVQAKMPDFVRKYAGQEDAQSISFTFQPLADIHLHSNLAREIVPNGNRLYVTIFFFVGGFILLIALINYINLSSALAIGRSKEAGIRAVLGANKKQVTIHAWVESIACNLLAMGFGSLPAYLVFPYVQTLTGIDFLLPTAWFVLGIFLMAVLCGLLSGVYPALILTSFRALDMLKHHKAFVLHQQRGSFSVKRVMVTLQFCMSILLIASAFVAYDQFRYLNEKNLGMQTAEVLAIPNVPNDVSQQYQTFNERVSTLAGVQQVAACMEVPSREIRDAGPVVVTGVNDNPAQAPIMDIQVISPGFADMMNLKFLAGEDRFYHGSSGNEFTEDYDLAAQPRNYLINETAMRQLGWSSPEEAIGQNIRWSIGDLQLASGPITGVVQDFHQETLKNKVDPTVLVYEPIWLRTFLVKVSTRNLPQMIASIQAIWDDLYPAYPMEYHFLDDLFEKLYTRERVQLHLLSIFSALAIFVAFLGLFSLIAYSLKTRVREIAIRRVLGANLLALVRLISREYVWVLVIGGLIALPLSYLAVTRWLQSFAYRVDISILWYVLTLGLVGLLLLVTVSLQTRLSTSANPADILKDE